MKNSLSILIILLMAVFVTPARAEEGFELKITSEAAGTARITGPEKLVKSAQGFQEGVPFAGCLYEIDWGDGQKTPEVSREGGPPFCASTLTHVYAKPGLYTVKARTYDPGPTDAPINIRTGTASFNAQ